MDLNCLYWSKCNNIDIFEHWTPTWRTCHVTKLCWKVEGKGQSCKTSKHQDFDISISENLSRTWFYPDQHSSPSTTTIAISTTIQTAKIEEKNTLCAGNRFDGLLSHLLCLSGSTTATTTISTRTTTTRISKTKKYEQQQNDAHLVPGIVPTDFGLLSSASKGRFSLSSRSSQLSLLIMMMMAMILLMASLFSIAGNNHKNVAVKTYFISLTLRKSHWTAQQDNIQENCRGKWLLPWTQFRCSLPASQSGQNPLCITAMQWEPGWSKKWWWGKIGH